MAKRSGKLSATILALAIGALAAGCGGSTENEEIQLGNVGWDENVAISNLTKVLL